MTVLLLLILLLTPAAASFADSTDITAVDVVDDVQKVASALQKAENYIDPATLLKRMQFKENLPLFIYNCGTDEIIYSSISNEVALISLQRDYAGRYFGLQQCIAAFYPGGSWVAALVAPKRRKEEPKRFMTYFLQIPGTPWQVGSGFFCTLHNGLTINDKHQLCQIKRGTP